WKTSLHCPNSWSSRSTSTRVRRASSSRARTLPPTDTRHSGTRWLTSAEAMENHPRTRTRPRALPESPRGAAYHQGAGRRISRGIGQLTDASQSSSWRSIGRLVPGLGYASADRGSGRAGSGRLHQLSLRTPQIREKRLLLPRPVVALAVHEEGG